MFIYVYLFIYVLFIYVLSISIVLVYLCLSISLVLSCQSFSQVVLSDHHYKLIEEIWSDLLYCSHITISPPPPFYSDITTSYCLDRYNMSPTKLTRLDPYPLQYTPSTYLSVLSIIFSSSPFVYICSCIANWGILIRFYSTALTSLYHPHPPLLLWHHYKLIEEFCLDRYNMTRDRYSNNPPNQYTPSTYLSNQIAVLQPLPALTSLQAN